MDKRPIHLIEIAVKVKIDFDKPEHSLVIVRKVERDLNGELVAKYALSRSDSWVQVPWGEPYPEETYLPVLICNNFSEVIWLQSAHCSLGQ